MINEDGVEIEHGMVVYEPWKGGYYRKSEVDEKIKRLRRALYKACANWAHHRVFVRYKTNEKAWENVERKCRAKAEEYK